MKDGKFNKLFIYILVVVLIITLTASVTYAYIVASGSDNFTFVTANGVNTTLTLTTVKESNDMVPLLDSRVSTAIRNSCVDKNNYDVCSLYTVKLSNSSSSESLYGYVKTVSSSYTNNNLRYQIFDSNYTAVTDVMTISNSSNTLVYFKKNSNDVSITSSGNVTYYFVIWLTDINSEQSGDYSKSFSGAIGFELIGANSDKLEANF